MLYITIQCSLWSSVVVVVVFCCRGRRCGLQRNDPSRRRLKTAHNVPQMAPTHPKRPPETGQEPPKTAQDGPKPPKMSPKRHPRGTPEASRGVRNRSKNGSENRPKIESGPKTAQVAPDLRFSMFFKGRKGVEPPSGIKSDHP